MKDDNDFLTKMDSLSKVIPLFSLILFLYITPKETMRHRVTMIYALRYILADICREIILILLLHSDYRFMEDGHLFVY